MTKWLTSVLFLTIASSCLAATQVCRKVTTDSGQTSGYMCYDNLAFNDDQSNSGTFFASPPSSSADDNRAQNILQNILPFKVLFQIYNPEKIAMSPADALYLEGDESFERASIKISFPF